jgi:hypothetical protein
MRYDNKNTLYFFYNRKNTLYYLFLGHISFTDADLCVVHAKAFSAQIWPKNE